MAFVVSGLHSVFVRNRGGRVGAGPPFLVALAAVTLLVTATCKRGDKPAASEGGDAGTRARPRGAVLILLDTVRADHLSCYGYDRPTSPNMDALARRGVRFTQVVAPSPWTLPSVGALLTAEYPERGFARAGKLSRSLVEHLARAGISTAAMTEGGYVSRAFGMDRGFGEFVEEEGPVQLLQPGQRRDPNARGGIENTFQRARRWLIEHEEDRFFLFLHTYEPHTPYTRRDFAHTMDEGTVGPTFGIELLRPIQTGEVVLSDSEVSYVTALYDGGILHADRFVGSFRSFLGEIGLAEQTLVIVTSDHGEELNDHYRANTGDHGHSLRDPLLMVPLIIFNPLECYAVREVSAQVRLIDLMPTIAELLGVRIDRRMDGKSLVPLMNGTEAEDRLALAAHTKKGPPRVGLRERGFKYIVATGPDTSWPPLRHPPLAHQLYDLRADPFERTNLVVSRPALARAMATALDAAYGSFRRRTRFTTPDVADPEVLERLRSLGYVGD